MARIRKFTNVKFGLNQASLALGPQGIAAAAVVQTAAIPVRGAKSVILVASGTDANVPGAAIAFNVTSDPAGSNQQVGNNASNGYNTLRFLNNMAMNVPGGIVAEVAHADGVIMNGFIVFTFTAHATNAHTAVQFDAYVVYDGEVSDIAQSFGQLTLTSIPSSVVS